MKISKQSSQKIHFKIKTNIQYKKYKKKNLNNTLLFFSFLEKNSPNHKEDLKFSDYIFWDCWHKTKLENSTLNSN